MFGARRPQAQQAVTKASGVLDTDGDGDVDLADLAGVTGSLVKLLRGQ